MMVIDTFFRVDKFNSRDLARRLYNEKPGAVLIPDFLPSEICETLLNEIHANKTSLVKAKEVYGRSEQRFFMYYFEWNGGESTQNADFPLISQFSQAYDSLSRDLVEIAELSQKRVSSTGIHVYWRDEKQGLSPHRDESPAQLISVFVLEGYSPFYVADDYELKTNLHSFEPKPGSLILMRGPRNALERELVRKGPNYNPLNDPRPIHCVGPVQDDRTVLLLRHFDESLREIK